MRNRRPLIVIAAIVLAVAAVGAALFFVSNGGGSANCDDGTEWGGYTECEAKDVLKDDNVETQICQNAPGDPATSPICQLYPTPEQVDASDLRRITFEGQEGWQWQHADQNFCIVVWEDPETNNFATLVSACVSD
jgi:hypothetical protein